MFVPSDCSCRAASLAVYILYSLVRNRLENHRRDNEGDHTKNPRCPKRFVQLIGSIRFCLGHALIPGPQLYPSQLLQVPRFGSIRVILFELQAGRELLPLLSG
jgi:hypothetical protein